jgi:AraC-like DNA-binding protein
VLLSAFQGLPELLEKFGVPSADLLQQYGLSREHLADHNRTAPYTDLSRLLSHCAAKTRCRHFGLLLSRSFSLRSLGIIGRLAQRAPTVEAALDGLVRYFALHDTGATFDLRTMGQTGSLSYTIHAAGVVAPEQIYDFTVADICIIMSELCGPQWRPELIQLPRIRPRQLQPYRAAFRAPIQFEALQAAVHFPSRWLSSPVRGADELLYTLLLREVSATVEKNHSLVGLEVRRAIVMLLREGRCSRTEVARALDLHERTLCRILQASGTTFRQVLEETRSELARQLLHDTHVPISAIAHELGFRNSTVMARAFRRWNGVSPREYRSGLRQLH